MRLARIVLHDGTVIEPSEQYQFIGKRFGDGSCMSFGYDDIESWGPRVRTVRPDGHSEENIRWSSIQCVFFAIGTVRVVTEGANVPGVKVGDELVCVERTGIDGRCALVLDPHGRDQLWTLGHNEFEVVEGCEVGA